MEELKARGEADEEEKLSEEKELPSEEESGDKFFKKDVPTEKSFYSEHDPEKERPGFFERPLPKDPSL